MKSKTIALVIIGLALILGAYSSGYSRAVIDQNRSADLGSVFPSELRDEAPRNLDVGLFWRVLDIIDEKYIHTVNWRNVLYGAVRGAVDGLGDFYTVFSTPEEQVAFDNELDGVFEGIGIKLGLDGDGRIEIITPLKDSPAYQAGIQPGDKIVKIDGLETSFFAIEDAVALIRGPIGSRVTLALERKGSRESFEVEMTRRRLKVDSVQLVFDDDLAVLSISRCGNDTEKAFLAAEREIVKKNPRGLIIDLRNNPGGLFDASVIIANELVASGTIVEERFKDEHSEIFSADGTGQLAEIPLVILINGGSASASEIVAGAVSGNDRGLLIGEQTFGKGLVQELEPLVGGSSLRISVAKWYTPSGISIEGNGLRPDIRITDDPKTTIDEPLERAKQELMKQ